MERTLDPKDPSPRRLNFSTVDPPLAELLVAVTNLLEREAPARVPEACLGAAVYLTTTMKLCRVTWAAIRQLCADKASSDDLPIPELSLAVPALTRSILDTVLTTTFLLEDLEARWPWFEKAGWRSMRIEYEDLTRDFGDDQRWVRWLEGTYLPNIDKGVGALGITSEEAADPRRIPGWPNPGRLWRYGLKENTTKPRTRLFMEALDRLFYADLSQQSHVSWLGVVKRGRYLLDNDLDSSAKRELLQGYRADQIFIAVTLLLALCSVLDERFVFDRGDRIRLLWTLVADFWDPAKLLVHVRYAEPLFSGWPALHP